MGLWKTLFDSKLIRARFKEIRKCKIVEGPIHGELIGYEHTYQKARRDTRLVSE